MRARTFPQARLAKPWAATFSPYTPTEYHERFADIDGIVARARERNRIFGGLSGGHACFTAIRDDGDTFDCRALHDGEEG